MDRAEADAQLLAFDTFSSCYMTDHRFTAADIVEMHRVWLGGIYQSVPEAIANGDLVTFARDKFAPMVRGLFPRIEHQPVLAVLEQSVVFLTPGSIEGLIRGEGFLSTAWQLATSTSRGSAPKLSAIRCAA